MSFLFYLFRFHHVMPDDFCKKGVNIREVIKGFVLKEIELREEEQKNV